jgi:hypothetical protein
MRCESDALEKSNTAPNSLIEHLDRDQSVHLIFFSLPSVPFDRDTFSDQCEDIDEIDTDDLAEAADDLLSEEDDRSDGSNHTEDSDPDEVTDDESSVADDQDEIDLPSLSIVDHGASPVDHYELLMSVFELLKKTRSGVKFIRNHYVTNESL